MRVLVIDNYDSFTYNLVDYLGELGAELDVVRNDVAAVAELLERRPDRLVISPGPCTPARQALVPRPLDEVEHDGAAVYEGLPNPLLAGRYHSLIADPQLPDELERTATYGEVVMGVRHRSLPAEGVQFHPESVLTPHGKDLLRNFLGG